MGHNDVCCIDFERHNSVKDEYILLKLVFVFYVLFNAHLIE